LPAIGQPLLQVEDENIGVIGVALSKIPRRNEFGVGINSNQTYRINLPAKTGQSRRRYSFAAAGD
jgi:hypothetical protein